MSKFYTLELLGLKRELPICPINEKLDIAAFVMFSDVEMTVESAKALIEKSPEFDVIITAESKGIPLAYEMAKQSGKKYFVGRKSVKLYMKNPISVNVKSITTAGVQTLYLDCDEAEYISGKKVLIVDDVISTGESLKALEELVEKSNGKTVAKATVLAEGEACDRDDIIYLAELPLFFK